MLSKYRKIIVLGVVILMVLCIPAGYGYISHQIVSQLPNKIKHILPPYIRLNYDNLKSENCLVNVCLSAQNVYVTLPTDKPNTFSVFELGTIRFESNLLGLYKVTTHPKTNQQSDTSIQITLSATGSSELIDVQNLFIRQNQFQATLSGTVSLTQQAIDLKGNAINLSDFSQQFIPENLRFLTSLLFKNTQQEITLTTDDEWIYFIKLPIIPKKLIFQ